MRYNPQELGCFVGKIVTVVRKKKGKICRGRLVKAPNCFQCAIVDSEWPPYLLMRVSDDIVEDIFESRRGDVAILLVDCYVCPKCGKVYTEYDAVGDENWHEECWDRLARPHLGNPRDEGKQPVLGV